MAGESAVERLQRWYLAQCDGDWEHQLGLKIETLDNPGWTMKFDLERTALYERPFEPVQIERTDNDWVYARVEDGQWSAACGPENLEEALNVFLDWAGQP